MEQELKCWLLVRDDLDMPAGKLATQSGHAYMNLAIQMIQRSSNSMYPDFKDRISSYLNSGQAKITVRVKNLDALERALEECKAADIPCNSVRDEGRTIFTEPTITVMAVGPCYRDELPKFVQRLQLL